MPKPRQRPPKRKEDFFRKNKVEYIDYKDVELLRKFISDRGKIRGARVTGTHPQQQRLARQGDQERPRDGPAALHQP